MLSVFDNYEYSYISMHTQSKLFCILITVVVTQSLYVLKLVDQKDNNITIFKYNLILRQGMVLQPRVPLNSQSSCFTPCTTIASLYANFKNQILKSHREIRKERFEIIQRLIQLII